MALPMRDQAKYWGMATAVFLFVLWWLGDVILPGDSAATTFGPWIGRGQFVLVDWVCDDSSITSLTAAAGESSTADLYELC